MYDTYIAHIFIFMHLYDIYIYIYRYISPIYLIYLWFMFKIIHVSIYIHMCTQFYTYSIYDYTWTLYTYICMWYTFILYVYIPMKVMFMYILSPFCTYDIVWFNMWWVYSIFLYLLHWSHTHIYIFTNVHVYIYIYTHIYV